tara:strand:- start:1403 stop:2296 length:894 start_codon:yes stop_codon:yes gene_type:complete
MSAPMLLDPHSLAELKGLSLRCQRVVDGLLQGLHRSPHHGSSVEFSEHKEYSPGDDVRHIDWKAYARLDKHYVKRFEHESNLTAWCLLDASGSMGYQGQGSGLTKLEYGSLLAVSLSYVLLKQQDGVGFVSFADSLGESLLPAARIGHLNRLCSLLENIKPSGGTNLPGIVRVVGEQAKRRGLVFVFSDFLSDPEADFSALRRLASRGRQMAVFHLVDQDEAEFPFDEMTLFEGMESTHQLLVEPQLIRNAYLKRFNAHCAEIKRQSLRHKMHYVRVDTNRPPHEVLMSFLARWNKG